MPVLTSARRILIGASAWLRTQVWLEHGSERKQPPEQLPIVLQVLLSQQHRLRALVLLGRFLDMGPWAVDLALSVGIFPYVLKLLQTSASDLRQILVFIWTKILALDKSCQMDLSKDQGHTYFVKFLDSPGVPSDQVIECTRYCILPSRQKCCPLNTRRGIRPLLANAVCDGGVRTGDDCGVQPEGAAGVPSKQSACSLRNELAASSTRRTQARRDAMRASHNRVVGFCRGAPRKMVVSLSWEFVEPIPRDTGETQGEVASTGREHPALNGFSLARRRPLLTRCRFVSQPLSSCT